jgi:hypothetical protein
MGLGGEGGGGDVEDVVVRAEKLSAEAVSHVFLTLCGTAEAPDKFTGMQVCVCSARGGRAPPPAPLRPRRCSARARARDALTPGALVCSAR